MTVQSALREGTRLLEEGGIAVPRLTAEVLLGHALDRDRPYLYAHPEAELGERERRHFSRCLHERLGGKPTQYITGRQEFWGREFRVTPAVLIPRPETEHVVETALELARGARRLADAGTGSGAIGITLQLETGAEIWATDISLPALQVAAQNAERLNSAIRLVACDLLSALAEASCDVVVSNPPYVPRDGGAGLQREVRDWEPPVALYAGPTGLEIYGRLLADAWRVLRPGGWLVVELGFGACEPVLAMCAGGWKNARTVADLAGIPRVLAAQRPG